MKAAEIQESAELEAADLKQRLLCLSFLLGIFEKNISKSSKKR
jgi:hypothetical protein